MKETPMFEHAATWHDASFDEAPRDEDTVRRGFWVKLRRVGASVPFAEDLLAAYYCAFDRDTPLQVKAALLGALAYFVLPFDAVPDVLPMVGFTDDAAARARASRMAAPGTPRPQPPPARAALARGVA